MKRILLLLILTIIAACGAPSQPESQPIAEDDAALEARSKLSHNPTVYTFQVTNNQVTIPQARNTDSACYLTWMQGNGGYAGQATWPNGTTKHSAEWYFERNYNPNVVSAQHLDGVGTKIARVSCSKFSNFESPVTAYQPPPSPAPQLPQIFKFESDGQGPHTADVKLWDTNSFCYLKNVAGLTHGGTALYTYTQADASSPTGAYWRLHYQGGSPTFGAAANCVYLGRPYDSSSGGIQVAYTNQPKDLGGWWGDSICFITGVWGDLNAAGAVWIDENGAFGQYRLNVSGTVWGASAMCVSYFWDQP
jgi:hypothetical protein